MHTITHLSLADAERALTAIQAELEARDKAAVIAVADAYGELIALRRMDGAPLASILVATNKAWTAAASANPRGRSGRQRGIRKMVSTWPIMAIVATSVGAAACR